MKNLLLIIATLLNLLATAQTKTCIVQVDVNFEHVKSGQRGINGVINDGSRFRQIRQGRAVFGLVPGTYTLDLSLAITGNPETYEKQIANLEIPNQDKFLLQVTIPDNYMPHFAYIPFLADSGAYFTEEMGDTLNCVDINGWKQGLWTNRESDAGNCIDYLVDHYNCYKNDTLIASLDFRFDYNACVVMNHIITVRKYKADGISVEKEHVFTIDRGFGLGMQPGVNTGFDHNQMNRNDFKSMLREYFANDFDRLVPTFVRQKKFIGKYQYSENGKLISESDL